MLGFLRLLALVGRYRLDTLAMRLPLGAPARWMLGLSPLRALPVATPPAKRLKQALEAIGPVAVKFGQAISTRHDLLPEDIAVELGTLQEQATPFDADVAVAIIEKSLDAPLNSVFRSFEREPLAAASISQVHAAKLHDGCDVVVKVLRPGVERQVERDLKLLADGARWLRRLLPASQRLEPEAVVEEYAGAVRNELDLRIEAANTAQLRREFIDSPLLQVPQVHWDFTRRNLLVMERMHGVAVDKIQTLERHDVDLRKLAINGAEIFFIQVFENNFFHADMHPGNVHVRLDNPRSPSYIALDCAVMGSLSDADLYYLARNLLAIFQRDYRLVAQLHLQCGWVPAHTDLRALETAVRMVCEPVFAKPLGEISLAHLLVDLFATARRFEMRVQPALVLLQKTLLQIEGLGRRLYPQLNLWDIGQPFLEDWIRRRYAPPALYKRLRRTLPGWLEGMSQQLQHPTMPESISESRPRESKPTTSANVGTALAWGLGLGLGLGLALIWGLKTPSGFGL